MAKCPPGRQADHLDRDGVRAFFADLNFNLGQASQDGPHFGTSYVEKAALALEEKLKGNVESLQLPERIEGQLWVRQGEELGQGLKEQLNTLLHNASARIDWTDLKSVTNSLSSLQQGQQQNLERMLSSLSATAGEACDRGLDLWTSKLELRTYCQLL